MSLKACLCALVLTFAATCAPAAELPTGCGPSDVEAIKTELRVKRIRDEYQTVRDILLPLRAQLKQHLRPPRYSRTEACMDIGALVHRIAYARGKIGSHEPYAHDREIFDLVSKMNTASVELSSYCMDGAQPGPGDPDGFDPLVAELDRLAALRDALEARL